MFANYKNLNCISNIQAYAGQDNFGTKRYVTLNYWTDLTPEL
jgi:hypothetical protein